MIDPNTNKPDVKAPKCEDCNLEMKMNRVLYTDPMSYEFRCVKCRKEEVVESKGLILINPNQAIPTPKKPEYCRNLQ